MTTDGASLESKLQQTLEQLLRLSEQNAAL